MSQSFQSLDATPLAPQPDEVRSIFAPLGLGGDFWNPQSDSLG